MTGVVILFGGRRANAVNGGSRPCAGKRCLRGTGRRNGRRAEAVSERRGPSLRGDAAERRRGKEEEARAMTQFLNFICYDGSGRGQKEL